MYELKKRDSVKESGLNTEISAIMKAMWNPPEIKGKTIEEVNQYLGKIEENSRVPHCPR